MAAVERERREAEEEAIHRRRDARARAHERAARETEKAEAVARAVTELKVQIEVERHRHGGSGGTGTPQLAASCAAAIADAADSSADALPITATTAAPSALPPAPSHALMPPTSVPTPVSTPVPTPVLAPPTPTPEHPCTRPSPLGTLYSANGPSIIVKTPRLAVPELGSCASAGRLVARAPPYSQEERPAQSTPSHCLRCSSLPPPKSPIPTAFWSSRPSPHEACEAAQGGARREATQRARLEAELRDERAARRVETCL